MLEVSVQHDFGTFALDFEFSSTGPVLGVAGASGSGKTTLLHAVAGLLRPQRARIAVRDELVCEQPAGIWTPP